MRPYWASPVGSISGLYLKATGRSLIKPSLSSAISRISSLKRREEVVVPSCPLPLTKTATPPALVAPLIPAMKVAVWVPTVPIRIVLDSPAPVLPMSMLLMPVARLDPALIPMAMLLLPVVRLDPAARPMAVLLEPVVLMSAWYPVAVLLPPVVLKASALSPVAVLPPPVVLVKSAWNPLAVLLPPVVLW